MNDKQKKIYYAFAFVLFIAFCGAVTWFVGRPLINFVSEPEKFRAWVDSSGIVSRFAFIGMMVFQVVIAMVPGEPFEIGAGYAFGAVEGTILCVLGVTLGSLIVYLLIKKLGVKFVEAFFSKDKLSKLKFLQNEKKLDLITFIIFFLPGTPKDLITYFVCLTKIKFSHYILIASVARLPSIITSTVAGGALGVKNYEFAVMAFLITLVISILGLIIYGAICKEKNKQ